MADFASLRKIDAIQGFNFGLRAAFEKHFTRDTDQDGLPDNEFLITPGFFAPNDTTPAQKWDKIKAEFGKQNFGDLANCGMSDPLTQPIPDDCDSYQFANFATEEIIKALQIDETSGAYISSIDEIDRATFKKILLYVFSRSAAHGNFLEVSNCDGTWSGCDGGGFYINLDFSRPPEDDLSIGVTDEVYEALPQIEVKKRDTCNSDFSVCGKVLKQPVFPRGVIRVFVPTRIFKALAGVNDIIDAQGMFNKNSAFKQQFKNIKLGVCDTSVIWLYASCPTRRNPRPPCSCVALDSCYPRTNFESIQTTLGFNLACVGNTSAPQNWRLTSVGLINGTSYNPYPETVTQQISMSGALIDYAKGVLENLVGLNQKANEILNSGGDFVIVKSPERKFVWEPEVTGFASPSRNVSTPNFSECEKVAGVKTVFVFEEKDPQYIIDLSHTTRFAVGTSDSDYFSGFATGPVRETNERHATCTTIETRIPIRNTVRFESTYSCRAPNSTAGFCGGCTPTLAEDQGCRI